MNPLVGAAIVGGVGSLLGGHSASEANAREAQRNRDFQALMSNTQYQRAVRDMRRAGLNPALAYSQGGAGTPSGSVMDVSQMGEGISKAAGSASQAMVMKREIDLLEAQAEKARSDALYTQTQRNQFNEYWNTRLPSGKTYLETLRDMQVEQNRLALVDASASAAESRRRQAFWDSPVGAFAPFGEFGGAAIKPLLQLVPRFGFPNAAKQIQSIRGRRR